MADDQSQTRASHRKFVPWYHFFTATVLFVNLIWAAWQLYGDPGFGTVMGVLAGGVLLGEPWPPTLLLGLTGIAAGIYLVNR